MARFIALAAVLAAFSAFASSKTVLNSPNISDCPTQFHSVSIHQDAKLCQIFDDKLPASMVYHVAISPTEAIAFYLDNSALLKRSTVRERTFLSNENNNYRVVVSPDGTGSQIDILVVSTK